MPCKTSTLMQRRKPTRGTAEFFSAYIDAFTAQAQTDWTSHNRQRVTDELNKLATAKGAFGTLSNLEQIVASPDELTLDNDETPMARIEAGWHNLAMEHFVDRFGRYGHDAIGSIAEAMHYATALATAFGTHAIYYRGEHRFGHPLVSRAERNLPDDAGRDPGLTDIEREQLDRFQQHVLANPNQYPEVVGDSTLENLNSPRWLPVMQHYDDEFGTRLLDVSTSIFASLYFACVSWTGEINDDVDGLLYVFLRGSGGLLVRGIYYEQQPEHFDEEFDDIAPASVHDSFRGWQHPSYFRIYHSSTMSGRELAQDGLFLVRGALAGEPNLGQGFKLRVPAEIKATIAKELWWAGYTPRRIVRGQRGEMSHLRLANTLGLPRH